MAVSCISLYSYIKPQLHTCFSKFKFVVYLYIPTSNHNSVASLSAFVLLYIFIFLHQTTTGSVNSCVAVRLYIFIFLHQTTTHSMSMSSQVGCISLYSYIKPQLYNRPSSNLPVVYLYIPTSNHNVVSVAPTEMVVVYLYIPTSNHNLLVYPKRYFLVVYLYIPTSNHNS